MKNIILSLVRDSGYVSYNLKIDGRTKNYVVLEEAARRVTHLLFSFKLEVYLKEGKLAYIVNRNFEDFSFSFDFIDADLSKKDIKKIMKMYPFEKFDVERLKGKSSISHEKISFNDIDETEDEKRLRETLEIAKKEKREAKKKANSEGVISNTNFFNLLKLTDEEKLKRTQLVNIVELSNKEAKIRQKAARLSAAKNKNRVMQNFRTFNKEITPKQKSNKKVNIWITLLFALAIAIFVSAMAVYGVLSVHFHTWEPTYKKIIIHSLLSAGIVVSTILYFRVYFGFRGGKND